MIPLSSRVSAASAKGLASLQDIAEDESGRRGRSARGLQKIVVKHGSCCSRANFAGDDVRQPAASHAADDAAMADGHSVGTPLGDKAAAASARQPAAIRLLRAVSLSCMALRRRWSAV
jgi:hypothetical protein